jgi:hypothetical protein
LRSYGPFVSRYNIFGSLTFDDENVYLSVRRALARFGGKVLSEEDDELDEEYDDDDFDEGWEEDFDNNSE